jgi:hypothetical protein
MPLAIPAPGPLAGPGPTVDPDRVAALLPLAWVARALVAMAVGMSIEAAFQPRPLGPPLQSITSPLAIDTLAGPLGGDQ